MKKHEISRRDALIAGPLAGLAAMVGIKPKKAKAVKIPPYPQLPDPSMPIFKFEDVHFYVTLNSIVSSFAKILVHRSNRIAPYEIGYTLRFIHLALLKAKDWDDYEEGDYEEGPGRNTRAIMTQRQIEDLLIGTFVDMRQEAPGITSYRLNENINVNNSLSAGKLNIGPRALMEVVAHDVRMTTWSTGERTSHTLPKLTAKTTAASGTHSLWKDASYEFKPRNKAL